MSDLDDFLTPTLDRQLEAEQALINGDPGPRLAMWSTQEPVTVFGAEKSVIGSEQARQVFHWLATRFSNCTDYRFELVAAGASGDLAYTVGYEHFSFSMDGGPVEPITLRVTHLYRREDGEWKTVHRHADVPPTGPLRSADTSTGVSVSARGQGHRGHAARPVAGGPSGDRRQLMEEGNDQLRGGGHIATLRNEEAFLQTDDEKPAIIAEPPPDPAQFKCWFCRKSHQQVQMLFGAEYPVRDPHDFANETLISICNECVTRFAESLAQDTPKAPRTP